MLFPKLRFTLFFVFAFVMSFTAFAQIEFFHGTWDEAVALAHKKNKVIFVDAYTDWCGPCKMMTAQTFTDPQLGAFFNENFINVKLDMEKGEGPAFARTYGVNAYPTLLFIGSSDKQVVHRVLGFRPAEAFLGEGKIAATKGGTTVGGKDEKPIKQKKTKEEKAAEKEKKKQERLDKKKAKEQK